MVSSIAGVGERNFNHILVFARLLEEDIEASILKALDGVDVCSLTVHLHTGDVEGIHQTLLARSLHEVSHVGVEAEVDEDDVVAELSHRTNLEHLELQVVEEEVDVISLVLREVEGDGVHQATASIRTSLSGCDRSLINLVGLPLCGEVGRTNHLIVDVVAGISMSLCVGRSIHAGAISERQTILRALGQNLRKVDPELSVPVLSSTGCRVNHDTTASVNTYAISND